MTRPRTLRIAPPTPLALGSASPRRRELLLLLDLPLVVVAAAVDEAWLAGEPPDAYLDRVTRAKLAAVRSRPMSGATTVLVADTIVVAPDGDILGKPADACTSSGRRVVEEARAMIDRLAGAIHEVQTRFLLAAADGEAEHAETVTTRVTFRKLGPGEAEAYAASGEGNDKAGGYAVQGRAAAFVTRIEGSYTNVVGLPLSEVAVALRRLGWW